MYITLYLKAGWFGGGTEHTEMSDGKISEESDEVGGACGKNGRRSPTKDNPRREWEEGRNTLLEMARLHR